jgi:hypothetical protein
VLLASTAIGVLAPSVRPIANGPLYGLFPMMSPRSCLRRNGDGHFVVIFVMHKQHRLLDE